MNGTTDTGSRDARDRELMTAGRRGADDPSMAAAARAIGPARLLFLLAAWLFVVSVVIQTILVGFSIFAHTGGSIHRDFAYVYGWLAPILVLLAGVGRVPDRLRTITIVLLVAFALQTVLPSLKDQYPFLSALHTVNALVIFVVGITLARNATDWIRGLLASQTTTP